MVTEKASSDGNQNQGQGRSENLFPIASFDEFVADFTFIRSTIFHGPTITYAFTRLELLAARFNLHVLLNGTRELDAQKSVPHRDFYNVRKVDTHVHHSGNLSTHLIHTLSTHPINTIDRTPYTPSSQHTLSQLSSPSIPSACMNQKHLLRFIKHKLRYYPQEVVIYRDEKLLTLGG